MPAATRAKSHEFVLAQRKRKCIYGHTGGCFKEILGSKGASRWALL